MRKCANCYFCSTHAFCSTNDIYLVYSTNFLVCRKFFLSMQYKLLPQVCCLISKFCCPMSKFCCLKSKFCCLMALVLPPYVKFLKCSTKVCFIFLGGCKSLSMDTLLLSKIHTYSFTHILWHTHTHKRKLYTYHEEKFFFANVISKWTEKKFVSSLVAFVQFLPGD